MSWFKYSIYPFRGYHHHHPRHSWGWAPKCHQWARKKKTEPSLLSCLLRSVSSHAISVSRLTRPQASIYGCAALGWCTLLFYIQLAFSNVTIAILRLKTLIWPFELLCFGALGVGCWASMNAKQTAKWLQGVRAQTGLEPLLSATRPSPVSHIFVCARIKDWKMRSQNLHCWTYSAW